MRPIVQLWNINGILGTHICISLPFAVLVVKINGAALNASNYQYQLAERGTPSPDLQTVEILLKDQNMVRAWGTNLTAITWAHAVNNQQLLVEALSGALPHYTELQVQDYIFYSHFIQKPALISSRRTYPWEN